MKIIGATVGTSLPKPNFDQTDPKKGDYIRGDRSFLRVDDTLTESGISADARATGDAISAVQLNIDSLSDEVDVALADKADATHNHDDKYYTESEIDAMFEAITVEVDPTLSIEGTAADAAAVGIIRADFVY